MRLAIIDHNLIAVEGAKKDDVNFVMVDSVFFERSDDSFHNTTDNNVAGYEVRIAPVNSIDMVLEITSSKSKKSQAICIYVEDNKQNRSTLYFTPLQRS